MNSTKIIEVIAEAKIGNFEIISLVLATAIGVITIIITYFFFSAVNEQVKQGKKILEYHDKSFHSLILNTLMHPIEIERTLKSLQMMQTLMFYTESNNVPL